MSTVWKFIRIIGLYAGSFVLCVLFAASAMKPLPDELQVLFAMLLPVAFVCWYESSRNARLMTDRARRSSGFVAIPSPDEPHQISNKELAGRFDEDLGRVAANASEAVRLMLEEGRRQAKVTELVPKLAPQPRSSSSQ